jgi:DNA-binding Xre family transcriptional regulator
MSSPLVIQVEMVYTGGMVYSESMIRWKLKDYLDRHGITVYQLAKQTEGKLSRNALYNLADNPESIRFENLDTIIIALKEITKKQLKVSDLLEFIEE